MKIYKTMRKRGLALFLALTMCLSLIQTTAFANEEAEHVHNEGGWTCAYTDPVTEPACVHEHDAACGYVEAVEEIPCVCTGTDGEGGVVHEDGCAYAPAVEGAPCGHVCGGECAAVVTEGYWECTPPAGEPEDTEPTEDAEAPAGDAEVPEEDAEAPAGDTEVPVEVQAFLDAVAAIPEITAENAAEVAEYVYGPVSEAYDALLGTEYEEREDVMEAAEAYAAAIEAVDAALEMEAKPLEVFDGGGIIKENGVTIAPNNKPADWTYGQIGSNGNLNNYGGQIVKKVDESGFYLRCPVNTISGIYCGHVVAEYTPDNYTNFTVKSSTDGIIKDWGYSVGIWGRNPCLQADFTAAKPGKTTVQMTYYVNFMVQAEKGYCGSCGWSTTIPRDYTWHKYSDYFDITVNADYVLKYDANGGSVTPESQRQTKASTSCTFNLLTPTRDGYTFKGWAEQENYEEGGKLYEAGEEVVLTWSEGYGSTDNPVTKTLYAVWEKDSEGSGPSLSDLTVKKTPSEEYPIVGTEFKYTIEVKNDSDVPAIVKVVDKLPKELDFVKVSQSDGGVYDKDTHTVTWESVTVPANGSKQLLVWVKANTAGKISNTATVHFGDETISGNTTVEAKSKKPEAPVILGQDGMLRVQVVCDSKDSYHIGQKENLRLRTPENNNNIMEYTAGGVVASKEAGYEWQYTVTLYKSDFATRFRHNSGSDHEYVSGTKDNVDVTFYYRDGAWDFENLKSLNPGVKIVYEKNSNDGYFCNYVVYHVVPKQQPPVQTPKIEVKKSNGGFQSDPETGNASVNYTVTVKNVSGFDLYGLKLTDELTPTLTATGEGEPTATYTFSNWQVKTNDSGVFEEIEPYQGEVAGKTHLLALLARNTKFKDQQTVTLTYTVEIKTNNVPAKVKLENTATAEYWTAEYTEPQTRAVRADGNDPFPDPSNGSVSSGSSTDTDGPTSGSSAEGTLPQKYTLSYNWDLPKGVTLDKTLPTDTLESRPANSHFTVDTNNKQGDEVTGSDGKTYVFSGWKVPADIQTETEGKYKGRYVMPARDVTITGTWTAKEEKAPAFDPTLLQSVNVKVRCSSDEKHDTDNNWRSLYGQNNGDNWTPWGDEYYTIGSVEKIDGKYQCVVTLKPEKWAEMRIAEFTDDAAGHIFDETAKDAKTCVTFTYDPDTESWKSDLKTAVVFIRETLETRTVEIVKAFYGPTQEQVEAIKDDFSITYTYKLNGKTETKTLSGEDAELGVDTFHLFEGEAVVMAWKANFTVNKGSTDDSGFGVISFVESGHHIDGFTWTGNGEGSSLDEQRLSAATLSIGLSNHYVPEAPTSPTEYTVTVRYVDTHGNTVRSDVRVLTTDGGKYDVTAHQVAISGYRCQGADRPLTGTVAGNTTITLTYVKQITVTWVNENGSTVHGPITIDENAPYSNPEGLDENGHWGSPVADANGNITIQWVLGHPATRTVTWLSGYGTNRVLHTGEIPWDTTDVPARLYPSDPYRSGYTFRGWGAPVIGEDGNITITARWQMIPPVTPPSGGGSTGGTTIPDTQTPLDPGTTIADQDVPLAAPGLNNTDHFDYIKGYVIDGQILVRPEANITRAEVATIFFRLMTKEFREANWATENDFTDVKKGDWYNNAISTCTKAGILKGYEDGTFKPNQTISREEFAAIAARFASEEVPAGGMFKDIAGRWSEKDIERAAAMGWIKGSNGMFRPVDKITRAEVIVIVNRMLDRVPDADHMLPDMKTFADNTPDMWWYADVQEAANSHEYDRAEDGVTGIWTSLLPEQDWAALEKEWATAADANVADVAPKPGAEEETKEPETTGGDGGNGEE